MKGLGALEVEWDVGPNATLGTADVVRELESASQGAGAVARREGDVETAMAGAATKVEATYQPPFLAHAALEPMNSRSTCGKTVARCGSEHRS